MKNEKHTPGPWKIGERTNHYKACGNEREMAILEACGQDKFEALSVGTLGTQIAIIPLDLSNEANARLIAAAPDLLEAAEKALELFPNQLKFSLLEEAIKKARGEK